MIWFDYARHGNGTGRSGRCPKTNREQVVMTDYGKIYFHYIGGRAGADGPFFLRSHANDLVFRIYDADPGCLDQLQSHQALKLFNFTAEAVIVRGPDMDGRININYDPFTSSCYSVNQELGDAYYRDANSGDYLARETFRTVRVHQSPAMTLAELVAQGAATLDFLTMDTQGSELEILKGAGAFAQNQLLGFIAEVEFEPLYQGQPLFSDIHDWSRSQGFRLVTLEQHSQPWNWHRAPIGWRDKGVLFVGDALYLKAPTRIAEDHNDPSVSLAKAAFIGLILGQVSYAAECFTLLPVEDAGSSDGRPYQNLVAEAAALYRQERGLFPPSFTDVFSEEQSFARFGSDVPLGQPWARDHPSIRQRYFSHVDKDLFLSRFPRLLSSELTDFEALLVRYEMKRTAAAAQTQRISDAELLAQLLGFGTVVDGRTLVDLEGLREALR